MAQLSINIPDAVVPRVMDAFAAEFVYDAGSGLTKAQFAKQQIILFMKDVVKRHENSITVQQASNQIETTRKATDIDIDTNVVLS